MSTPVVRPARAFTIVLLCTAAVALALRALAVAQPLGIDQSLWASAVRGLSHGQVLYRDVWEQRPPGIYLTYLWGFQAFGWTASAVAWLDLLAAAVTTAALALIARQLATWLAAGAVAAIYAGLTMPAWLYGHGGFLERSVSETFISACTSVAALCAVRGARTGSLAWAAGLGLFGGAAIGYKPNAALYLPALLGWMALASSAVGPWRARARAASPQLAVAVAAAALVPVAMLVWLWRVAALDDARVAVIDFNRFYVAQGFTLSEYAVAFSKAVWLRIKTEPLWTAGVASALVALWEWLRRGRVALLPALGLLWGTAATLAIIVNGSRLFNAYFIQALPPLALMAAWWFTRTDENRPGRGRAVRFALAGLCALLLVSRSYVPRILESARADYAVLAGTMDRTQYLERFGGYANGRGYSARANDELAAYVRARTRADESIFLFGINGAGVYFGADRLPAHRFLRVNFFVPAEFPDPAFRLEAVVADLEARRPRYLVFERLHSRSEMGRAADALAQDPAVRRLLEQYDHETVIEDFSLYRLRGDE